MKPIKVNVFQKKFMMSTVNSFSKKETQDVLSLLAELLQNGFNLEQSLDFLVVIKPKKKKSIKHIKRRLIKGNSLSESLGLLNLTASQKAQLSFAEIHGDLVSTLLTMSEQMIDKEKQKQHLIKLISYPILLLVFLFGAVLGMKCYILPQMTELYTQDNNNNIGLLIVNNSPLVIGLLVILTLISYFLVKSFLAKKSAIEQANWWSRIPIVNQFYKAYYTSLFASEWGRLLIQGMEFRDVVLIMTGKNYTPLMREMAQGIEKEIEKGIPINGPIKEWHFLNPELSLIILQGEVKGNLGKELLIYGRREWEGLMKLADKKIRFLQPMMFLLIAVLIISVYSALLLPIYKGMGDMY